jgi:uncharacterized membrane protein
MDGLLNKVLEEAIWPFVVFLSALAVLVFIWGVIEFMANADNQEKRTIGKRHLVWGIIGMFIMASVYGIIQIIQNFVSSMG